MREGDNDDIFQFNGLPVGPLTFSFSLFGEGAVSELALMFLDSSGAFSSSAPVPGNSTVDVNVPGDGIINVQASALLHAVGHPGAGYHGPGLGRLGRRRRRRSPEAVESPPIDGPGLRHGRATETHDFIWGNLSRFRGRAHPSNPYSQRL